MNMNDHDCPKCNDTGEITPNQLVFTSPDDYMNNVGETIKYCNCKKGHDMSEKNLKLTMTTKPFQN